MKFPVTLRARLSLLVLLAIVPLFGLSLLGAVLTTRDAVTQITKDLEFSASLIAANQERVADSARKVLSTISLIPGIVEGKESNCQRYFKALTAQLPVYTNIGIVGIDGTILCHSVPNTPEAFTGDRPWFQSAIAGGDFGASGYLLGRISGKPIIIFSLPIKNGDGKIQAIAFAGMLLSEVSKNITSALLPAGQAVVLLDHDGVVLATNSDQAATVGKPLPIAGVGEAIKANAPRVFDATDASGAERIYAFRPSNVSPASPFFVLVSADRIEVLAPALERLIQVLSALMLITLFGMWVAWLLVGRAIVKPAVEILEATRRIQSGALGTRIPVRPGDEKNELTRIAKGFNGMADSLQQREQSQAKSYAELSQSQTQLLAAQKLGRIGHWHLDMRSNRLTWSENLHDLFGLKPGEFDGDHATFLNMIHPDDRARYDERRAAAHLSGTELEIEYRITTPAGNVRWMHQRGQVPANQAGRPLSRSGVVQDITEQHNAREHLRLLETAIARLNDVILITEAEPLDKPGPRIVFVNDAFERNTGYSREEALGRSPRFLQGPHTQQSELRRISQAFGARQSVRAELINYTKARKEYWIELEITPIANDKGCVTHFVSVQRDITQRKAAEKALIQSEQRYAALFEKAPVPMWVFDAVDHRFLTVNRAAVENYGYSVDEFQFMTIFDIRDEADHTSIRNGLLGLTEPRPYWQHRRKDGSHMKVKVVAKSIQYQGREACFVVALDITPQVNAETNVKDQILMLQHAAEAAQAITWHQTVDGMLQEVVDQARNVMGAHQSMISLTRGDDLPPVISALSVSGKYARYKDQRNLPGGSGIYGMVREKNRVVRMTQAELEAHPRWHDFQSYTASYPVIRGWLAVPLTGRIGQNIGMLQLSDKYDGDFTLLDEYVAIELAQLASVAIENARLLEQVRQLNAGLEKKVAERTLALARQEALFRALAEQAPQVIWTADSKGVGNYFNRAWFDLVGGTPADWVGLKGTSVTHPDDRPGVRENWARAVATRSPFVGIRRLRGQDGSYHVMSYRAAPVLDEQGEVSFWVGIDADVTEIKSIESALRLSNQELEAFSYSVSHDLRAPLNTIDGFSKLLAKQMTGDAGSKAQHYLTRIQAGVAQMGKLIEDLLALAQVSRMELRPELVDLSALSRRILDDWQARDPKRQVELHIQPGLVAQGDASLLRVLMENLLGNAWKFTSQRANANITVGQQPDAVGPPVFFVRDDGAGFDMAYADKLFVAFQRLHAASEFPGTGVGLATVGRVIGRHGGQLWADASPGKGATFFFTLPKMPVAPSDDRVSGYEASF